MEVFLHRTVLFEKATKHVCVKCIEKGLRFYTQKDVYFCEGCGGYYCSTHIYKLTDTKVFIVKMIRCDDCVTAIERRRKK
jgi:hypothetical protein